MVKVVIDNLPLETQPGLTVLKAAQQAGISIPHLCYHPAFIPEGSCRMCLVEIEGLPKLELACSTVVREGMKISTQSPRVREARRGVLEFLLADHPLDCPICDKAGECKLQDYYGEYGLFESAFREEKEKKDKKIRIADNLILDRERCILCTRCVRFLREVTKTQELGIFHRGIRSEISTYEAELVQNNYSVNLVDLCPVGAITDTEFRFKTRAWFLKQMESICPLCSQGCNIYVDYHPGFPRIPGTAKVFRIRPRANDTINGHWICNFGRAGYLLLEKDRWMNPVWRKGDRETILSWEKALQVLAEKLRGLGASREKASVSLLLNSGLTNETLFLTKKIFKDGLGLEKIYFADPRPGTGDGLLLQPDRTSNARGAKEMGFSLRQVGLEDFSQGLDILIIIGPYLAELFSPAELKPALDPIGTKFLLTSRASGLESLVDFVLPASSMNETSGTLTNKDGIIQRFSRVFGPCGESRPEWVFIRDLGKELDIPIPGMPSLTDLEAVFRELGHEIPFFRNEPSWKS